MGCGEEVDERRRRVMNSVLSIATCCESRAYVRVDQNVLQDGRRFSPAVVAASAGSAERAGA